MPTRARLLAAASALTVTGLAAAALAPAAESAAPSLQGTVTYTTTTVTSKDSGTDSKTSTESQSVTMMIKMSRRPAAHYWQVEDNGSSYTGKYTLGSTALEKSADGTVNCTTTHAGSATAGGKLPKRPKGTTPPALFADITPGTSALNAKTKQIVLTPILGYKGEDTTTYAGSGISPCEPGTFTDPITGSFTPSNDSRQVCYPAGTSAKGASARANGLVGAWNSKKRAFVFTCSKTYDDGNGGKVTTTVSGILKLK
jgi:hypothetical protein